MPRIHSLSATTVLLALASAPALSQQRPTPFSPEPAKQDAGLGPQLERPQVAKPPGVPSNPDQRPQSSSPITSTGPAKPVPVESSTPQQFDPTETNQPKKVAPVTDQPVRGLIQGAPDRFYDPATGRYYKKIPPSGKPG